MVSGFKEEISAFDAANERLHRVVKQINILGATCSDLQLHQARSSNGLGIDCTISGRDYLQLGSNRTGFSVTPARGTGPFRTHYFENVQVAYSEPMMQSPDAGSAVRSDGSGSTCLVAALGVLWPGSKYSQGVLHAPCGAGAVVTSGPWPLYLSQARVRMLRIAGRETPSIEMGGEPTMLLAARSGVVPGSESPGQLKGTSVCSMGDLDTSGRSTVLAVGNQLEGKLSIVMLEVPPYDTPLNNTRNRSQAQSVQTIRVDDIVSQGIPSFGAALSYLGTMIAGPIMVHDPVLAVGAPNLNRVDILRLTRNNTGWMLDGETTIITAPSYVGSTSEFGAAIANLGPVESW